MTNSGATPTILTTENIQDALKAVADYRTTADQETTRLREIIGNLTTAEAGFNGDSADGYNVFLESITKSLQTNYTTYMDSIKQILDAVNQAILLETDPDLGSANRNAASNSSSSAAPTV